MLPAEPMGLGDVILLNCHPLKPSPMTPEEKKARVLMEIRGYKEEASKVLEEPRELKGFILMRARDKDGKVVLFLCSPSGINIGAKHIEAFRRFLEAEKASRGIVIARGRYTKDARTSARRPKVRIELIPKEFPSFNIFKHEMVPEHRILSPEEAKEVLAKYRVKPYQLPWIRASDPAVIAIGAKPGDIIEIRRKSPTAGEAVFYRYVVEV